MGRPVPADVLQPLSSLTTHNGVPFARDQVRGRPVAVVFGFTHCSDVCPTTLLEWSNMLTSLGPDGDRLKVLFVSVDSERDTPEALQAYMASFDPRIVALTGTIAAIAAAAKAFDAFYEKVADVRRNGGGEWQDAFSQTLATLAYSACGERALRAAARRPDTGGCSGK